MNKELKKKIYLKKGKLRKLVYDTLTEPLTSSELSKKLGKHRSSISRALIDLKKAGLIKCINPNDDRFRHYTKK